MRQVAVSLPIFRCVIADEYLGQIVFTVKETAARREAEQLRVLQYRSTETVEETAARREAEQLRILQYRSTETVEETAARREAEQLHVSQSRSTFLFLLCFIIFLNYLHSLTV